MWHDMDSIQLVKQALQLLYVWQLQLVLLVGVCLSLMIVIETNIISVSQHCISHQFALAVVLNSCTQVTGHSAAALKVDVVYVGILLSRCLRRLKTIHVWLHHQNLNVYFSKTVILKESAFTKYLFIYLLQQTEAFNSQLNVNQKYIVF